MGIYHGSSPLSLSAKSAYHQAVAGGYIGTEDDFNKALAAAGTPPAAKDVSFDDTGSGLNAKNVQEAVNTLFTNVSDGKRKVASAVADKGVPTTEDATFDTIAEHVRSISTGADTSDADITAADVRSGKVGYGKDGKIVGAAPNVAVPTPSISVDTNGLITAAVEQQTGFAQGGTKSATTQLPQKAAQTYTPGTSDQVIQSGQYLTGAQTIKGDGNLRPDNIKKGVTIFGQTGTAETGGAPATVTLYNNTSGGDMRSAGSLDYNSCRHGDTRSGVHGRVGELLNIAWYGGSLSVSGLQSVSAIYSIKGVMHCAYTITSTNCTVTLS